MGRFTAEQSEHYRLDLYSGKVTLAAMYFRRARVLDRCFAAALTHVLAAVTPHALAAQNLGVGFRRPCRGQAFQQKRQLGRSAADQSKYYRLYMYSSKFTLATMYLRRVRVAGRCFAAAEAPVSTVVTSPAPAAKTSAWASKSLPGAEVWQEKNNSADVQRSSINITGLIQKVVS
jgi:hypothetical protein